MCSSCGATNPAGQRFCGECGARLASGCPACGAAVGPDQRFCGDCGSAIAGAGVGGIAPSATASAQGIGAAPGTPGLRAGPAPTAERRLVSVLFADLVGFTPFAEERDAELVRETLSRYFELASDVVGRYGGTVEKFIGDAVMAVWGVPVAHEDDAERAVRAALDLVDVVRTLGPGILARAGVLTGEAAVTLGATNQGMVAGDLVNTAARLQGVAPAGAVLVGEATRDGARRAIVFEAAGEQLLKGKTAPVPAWRALRVVAERGGAGRGDGLESPFVGRADELRLLKEQFHATGREQRARLASLVGQAGIGKSRLAWEMEKYLDGLVEVVRWHRGRSPAYGEGVTFWALGEMIRRRAGLAEGDDEPTTRAAVAAMLAEHVPDADDRHWIEPRILVLLGLEETPSGGRDELFAAWRTFFERLAAAGTVVLVFEDIQWADDGLLDFIEHLLDWGRSHPIFVVTLARPELLDRRPGWGTDRRGAVAMRLDPLSEPAMRELLEGLVPGMPGPVLERILARADGIPLYAVETIRMLVADGRLEAADGAWRPTGDLGDLEVPATLHALVAARLDGLGPEERQLIQVASVLGQSFTLAALAAVTGDDEAGLTARLASLRRRELLVIETDPRAPTRGQHAFVQALVREVAYGTLSKRERRSRHMAAARYFESLDDDELAGALATHYLAAYRAAPEGPEGEAAAAQARVSLRGAADRAEALGALVQAAEWLREALEVTTDPVERAAMLQRIGWTEVLAGRSAAAESGLAEAVAAWRAIGDRPAALHATALLGSLFLQIGQIARAGETMEPWVAEAEALADDPAAARALARFSEVMGRTAFRSGRNESAIEWCDRALRLAEPLRVDDVILMALITKGVSAVNLGRYREGVALLNGAYLDALARGQHIAALRAGVNLAAMTGDTDPRGSLGWTRDGITMARRLGLLGFAPYHVSNASTAIRTGEWAWFRSAAKELAEEVRDPATRTWMEVTAEWLDPWLGHDVGDRPQEVIRDAEADGDPQALVNGLSWAVDVAFVREDFASAVVHGRRILEHPAFANPNTTFTIGRCALHAGDLELARDVAATLEPPLGGATDADLAALRAGIAAGEGRADEALAGYRTALGSYRDLGLRFDVAMTGLDMAVLVGPDVAAVRAAAADALEIFRELEAAPMVARLERLLASGRAVPASSGTRPQDVRRVRDPVLIGLAVVERRRHGRGSRRTPLARIVHGSQP